MRSEWEHRGGKEIVQENVQVVASALIAVAGCRVATARRAGQAEREREVDEVLSSPPSFPR